MPQATVVFADLTGSTGLFETLGNVKATQAVTRLTQWIGTVCAQCRGRVVKNLGDGVLMVFVSNADAIATAIKLQRQHSKRVANWPAPLKIGLKIGLACGDVVEQDGDFFGDAVNLASRLSDLSGPEQILASLSVIEPLLHMGTPRARCLGAMEIRGRTEACVVYRIEWQADVASDFMTMPAVLATRAAQKVLAPAQAIRLSWRHIEASFATRQLPILLGRDSACQFAVDDPRVSRRHASIACRSGIFYLEDISSFGTWVRASDGSAVIALRRQECVLNPGSDLALGAPFDELAVAVVRFDVPPPVAKPLKGSRERATKV